MRAFVAMVALSLVGMVGGCAQRPAAAPVKNYPVTGETMMYGSLRVLSSVLAVRGVEFQVDNAFRLRQDGNRLGVCMSYVYRGPEALWEQARREYPPMAAVSITPPAGDKAQPIAIALDPSPGYRLIPGVRMGVEELKTMRMACVTTELAWSPAYEGKEAKLAIQMR